MLALRLLPLSRRPSSRYYIVSKRICNRRLPSFGLRSQMLKAVRQTDLSPTFRIFHSFISTSNGWEETVFSFLFVFVIVFIAMLQLLLWDSFRSWNKEFFTVVKILFQLLPSNYPYIVLHISDDVSVLVLRYESFDSRIYLPICLPI